MAGPNLTAVNTATPGTAPETFEDVPDMTSGSISIAGTSSVIRLKMMLAAATQAGDHGTIYRFAMDGSPISGGPVVQFFNDATDEANGACLTHYVDGVSAGLHTFTLQWQRVGLSGQIASTAHDRRFEVTEFETGVTIKIDVNDMGIQAIPTTLSDITGLTGTFTTVSGAGYMMVGNITHDEDGDSSERTADLRFAVDGTPEGPYSAAFGDDGSVPPDRTGATMEYMTDGLSAASHDFSLQADETQGTGGVWHATYVRTFQVIEFESGTYTLDIDVDTTSTDTTLGGTMDGMEGTATPDGSGSIITVLATGVLDGTGITDACADLQITKEASLVGGKVLSFYDSPNDIPGFHIGHSETGLTLETDWALAWEVESGSGQTTGPLNRTFQVIDFSEQVDGIPVSNAITGQSEAIASVAQAETGQAETVSPLGQRSTIFIAPNFNRDVFLRPG